MDPEELHRLLRGSVQRAFPEEALRCQEELRHAVDALQRETVFRLRQEAVSWGAIARPIGISRQALQRRAARWGRVMSSAEE